MTLERQAKVVNGEFTCPNPACGRELRYFSGQDRMPAYLFCEHCADIAYDENTGKQIARLE